MAVEIIHRGKNTAKIEILYQFSKDEPLSMVSPLRYSFNKDTEAKIEFMGNLYTPVNIHIGPKIHKTNDLDHECEMVLEASYQETKRLFICIGLKFETDLQNAEWIFPLKSASLESMVSKCQKNHLYQTKGGNHVCVCTRSLVVNGVRPPMTNTPKGFYGDIIDTNSFDVLSLLHSSADSGIKKVESKTTNLVFKKKLLGLNEDVREGFLTNKDGKEEDTYMECKLLEEDATDTNEVYEDVAIVPLKTNTYERSISMFTHLLHFSLIIFGGFIIMPFLFITLFSKDSFLINGNPNMLSTVVRYFSTVVFFIGGIIMMVTGLSQNKYDTSKNLNYDKMSSGMLTTIIGLYFVVFHMCFSIGMFAWKMIEFDKFKTMFNKDQLGVPSSFDILNGMFATTFADQS